MRYSLRTRATHNIKTRLISASTAGIMLAASIGGVLPLALNTTAEAVSPIPACSSDNRTFDTFSNGSVNGQFGWTSTNTNIDQSVVDNTYGYETFGCKSLRMSNAYTTNSFSDQTFSYATASEAGETSAENDGLSSGPRQNSFEASWDFASTSSTQQPGLNINVSPDRGDGARMSWINMEDLSDGLAVGFYDYQRSQSGFVYTQVASGLDRTTPHNITVKMSFLDGSTNDTVRVYVDGSLVHTGTSWEDYFPDREGKPTRTVDSLLFRVSGANVPATAGNGLLLDNVVIGTATDTVKPSLTISNPNDDSVQASSFTTYGTMTDADSGINSATYTVTKINAIHGSYVSTIASGDAGYNSSDDSFAFDASGLASGYYRVKVVVEDNVGNTRTKYVDVEVDATKPQAAITSPSTGSLQSGSFEVNGTASDLNGIDRVEYRVNQISAIGGSYVQNVTSGTTTYNSSDNSFNFDITGLSTGYYRLRAQAFDNFNNYRYSFVDVQVDADLPNSTNDLKDLINKRVTVNQVITDNLQADSGKLRIWKLDASNDPDNTKFWSSARTPVDAADTATYAVDTVADLYGDGDYIAKFTSWDTAGNASVQQKYFTVDNTAPEVTIAAVPATVNGTFVLNGTASDATSGLRYGNTNTTSGGRVRVSFRLVSGTSVSAPVHTYYANVDGSGHWSLDVDSTDSWFMEGQKYRIIVRANDNVGDTYSESNTATATVQTTIDNTSTIIGNNPTPTEQTGENGSSANQTAALQTLTSGGTINRLASTATDASTGTTAGNGEVLGTTTDDEASQSGETKSASTNADITTKDSNDSGRFLGLGWWWILVLSGVGLLAYYWFVVRKADQA